MPAFLSRLPKILAGNPAGHRHRPAHSVRLVTLVALASLVSLATLVAGCGVVQPARVNLPALVPGSERVVLQGLGAGVRGSTLLLGQPLQFERDASRLSFFDQLARTDRSGLLWRVEGAEPQRGDCRSRRRTHTLGVIELVGQPLVIECRFMPSGGLLTLTETPASTRSLRSERTGVLEIGRVRWTVRSLHRAEGAVLDTEQPLGYVIAAGDQSLAVVERDGTRPVLHLPPQGDPRRALLLPALVSLALLWDESGA